ncbi:MAG: nuclear transport factor 2 family protein [Acidobacteriota bacterium]
MRARLLVLVLMAAAAGCRAVSGSAPDPAAASRSAAEWDELFNAHRLGDLALLYASDADSMPYDTPTVHGRPAIQAMFESFNRDNDDAHHETTVDELVLTPDRSIERGHYRMTYTPKATHQPVVETGRHVMERRWIEGRWQIVWEVFNTDKP